MIEDRTSKIEDQPTGATYWRSLDELADTPEFRQFAEQEFPSYSPEEMTGATRRQFLKLMGASVALAGFASLPGCRRWPREQLAPYAHRPEYHVPGSKEFFATAMEQGGFAKPLLITCVDGRPVKVEGNPDHPASMGTADSYAQASILDMYDPYRTRAVMKGREQSDWKAFDAWWAEQAKAFDAAGGKGLVVLSEATGSPTVGRLKGQLLKRFPQAQWVTHEAIHRNGEIAGTKLAVGQSVRPVYDLSKADVIVALDSDFMMRHPDALRLARQFADRRRTADTDHTMNRLYVVEPTFTVTGTMADERLAANMADVAKVVEQLAIASGVISGERLAGDSPVARFVTTLLEDLQAHGRNAVVIAGDDQPAEIHALVVGINLMRGHVGRTVRYIEDDSPVSSDTLPNEIETLVVLGGDPAYTAPFELKAKSVVALTGDINQTAADATWSLPGRITSKRGVIRRRGTAR
jgi:MoCo/4Fe-4S cofactor protein with predicted Tat translocation signal